MAYPDYTQPAPGSLQGVVKMRDLVSAVAQAKSACVKHSMHACGIWQAACVTQKMPFRRCEEHLKKKWDLGTQQAQLFSLHPGLKGCPVLTSICLQNSCVLTSDQAF